jgi:hypothetical protein
MAAVAVAPDAAAQLTAAGLALAAVHDVSDAWTAYTADRVADLAARRAELEPVVGEEVYASLHRFYAVIAALFAAGRLGGAVIRSRSCAGGSRRRPSPSAP